MPSPTRPPRRAERRPTTSTADTTAPARRPDLSAGDLLRTAAALGVQDATTLRLLASQLGLGPSRRQAAEHEPAGLPAATPAQQRRTEPKPMELPALTLQGGGTSNRPADVAVPGGPPGPAAQASLEKLPPLQAGSQRPAWLADGAPTLARGTLRPPAVPDPLFSPPTTRALGAAVAAVRSADGDVDIDSLVTALAGREPLQALPRQRVWTLRRGLQVLTDAGPGMEPYAADVQQLLAVLARLIGSDRLQVQAFEGEPLQGAWPADEGQPAGWQPPAPGVPVLVLSDFGIARPPGMPPLRAAQWRPFVQAAGQGGHPLRALLPFAPARWPTGLPRGLRLLAWDRHTTVAAVRRLLAD